MKPWRGERAPVLAAVLYAEMHEGGVWGRGWLVGDALAVLAASLRSHALCAADRMAFSPSGW